MTWYDVWVGAESNNSLVMHRLSAQQRPRIIYFDYISITKEIYVSGKSIGMDERTLKSVCNENWIKTEMYGESN